MKLCFGRERVMAVVAHPDDAELLCAGTLARAKADGASVGICVLCRGDKGQPAKSVAHLAAVRKRETAAAAELLGAGVYFAGFADGTLTDNPRIRKVLTQIYREFRPTLVLAHSDEDYHPDHRAASQLAEAASWFSASSGHKSPSPALELPPALWWIDTVGMSRFQPGFYIDISDYAELKERMLACHRSQLSRAKDANFTAVADLMRLQYRTRGAQAGVAAAEAFQIHDALKRTRAW
ncbi:MAG: PIG-L family deacetylase [Verrucomicrobia bacterium]|nr:PIG-L family deacetylase [Verrucomicrobiota bacterium]